MQKTKHWAAVLFVCAGLVLAGACAQDESASGKASEATQEDAGHTVGP